MRLHIMQITLTCNYTCVTTAGQPALANEEAGAAGRKGLGMIDVEVPLLSHDCRRLSLREAAGEQGLVAVCVGQASGRGFQLLHRFEATCDRLDATGVNVVFVYPAKAARHAQDALSVMAARYRRRPSLLLDDTDLFFVREVPVHQLCAMRFDRYMTCVESVAITVREPQWDVRLREFLVREHNRHADAA
ncbi:hypothetical protein ACFPTO_03610 [Paraburkholderia denitrificans]|uniref:Uncharacterized protein n=1 Tax=Paraburkholderia denitrificans TaxID=694025 RepID=A0ABW0J4J7_9BURK